MSDDAAVLFPGKTITIMGEDVVVRPYSFVVAMTQAAKPARSIVRALAYRANSTEAVDAVPGVVIVDLLADNGEDVLQLIALAVDKPKAWLDTLPMDAGAELAAAVLEVNRDFFSQKLEPVLAKLAAAIGAPSPPPSSAPVTPGPPSSPTP